MKITDKRCITLTRLEVKEILLKALCAMHPGYQPGEADHGDCVDLSDMPPEIEVVLAPIPPRTSKAEDSCDRGLGA